MREFLLANCPILIWIICAAELVMFFLLLRSYRNGRHPMSLSMALISLGLFVDAFIIVLGSSIPEGALAPVSRIRYISHGLLIPLIFAICAYALHFSGKSLKAAWLFTGFLMAAGLAEALAVKLETKELAGVVRCVSAPSTPAWSTAISNVLSFGTVIPLMIVGIIVWIKQKTPALFLSGFFMFAFSALGPATGNTDLIFFISMFGEVLMILFFLLYDKHHRATER